ncbi:MAG: chromosomal replication initiator protein DnaA [Verrucomicrobia bacterium]|nr:chromosomal replication initiator protein DnaA [Verrucomicrobiota bacterium]
MEWEKFLETQEREFGKETIDRWLRSLQLQRFDAGNLYLEAKDSFQVLWFEEHIRHKLSQFRNRNQRPIKVHLSLAGGKQAKKPASSKKEQAKQPDHIYFEELDPSCTFEDFILFEENEIGYRVLDELCTKILAKQTSEFNPLYFYGPPGSGKTHLLQATAERLRRAGYNAIYVRAELFTDHVVRSIRIGEMSHFRKLYRNADILLVDDVQCFARKNATQEEFFHTFNTLHIAGKQIILAANVTPQSLAFIEPRLISRFEWGISLPLAAPEKKNLIKLIEKKAAFLNFPIASRISEFLAETFFTNPKSAVRALEALILRSHLHQNGKQQPKQPLQISVIKNLLSDLIDNEKTNSLSPERIVAAVAEYYTILPEDLCGKSQAREFVTARQVAMYLCRSLLKIPYMKIGEFFTRDHSTVMAAIKQVQKQVDLIQNDVAAACNAIQLKLL